MGHLAEVVPMPPPARIHSAFVPGGRPNVVEEAANVLEAMAQYVKAPEKLAGLPLEVTIQTLEFQAELLRMVATEMRENGDVA
jgi:hypothetical protein